jgi:uncharacterized protein YceK
VEEGMRKKFMVFAVLAMFLFSGCSSNIIAAQASDAQLVSQDGNGTSDNTNAEVTNSDTQEYYGEMRGILPKEIEKEIISRRSSKAGRIEGE